jgi:signal transduction histidine kinase/CheY-like chemotaxis protein
MRDKTILLVDDEEDIRLVLSISLADLGYEVITAENGEQALEIFHLQQPPIVISDIKMPDIDGIVLLREIKRENPDVEVIMITGHGDMDVAIESFQLEATDFITKPINIDSLEKALNKVQERIMSRRKLREYMENLEALVYAKSTQLNELEQMTGQGGLPEEFKGIHENFRQVFNHMPCYLMIVDREFRLTAANSHYKGDFGEEMGVHCYRALKQSDEPCPDCPAARTMVDGRSHQGEMELSSAGGRKFNVIVWTSPLRNAAGEITHSLVMSTNTSEILEVRNHLSALGLLIGSVSHGIKGLLTGLDGGMYLIESGVKKANDQQIREGLDVVKVMVGRIRSMILDILLYAKERELKKELLDFQNFASELLAVFHGKTRERSIELETDCDRADGGFEADSAFLRTALINVMDNAVEACAENKPDKPPRIMFRATPDQDQVLFEIIDNGPGMTKEVVDNIFNLFYSTKGKKGTGLGLYITNKIVQQHRGEIQVDSHPGQGTAVRVKLPRLAADQENEP